MWAKAGVLILIALLQGTQGSERTKAILESRKTGHSTAKTHVGPPPRDAAFHGSLNASLASPTPTAESMRQACRSHSQPHSQQLAELERDVAKLGERLGRFSPDKGGLPAFRRRLAHLGLCFGALSSPTAETPDASSTTASLAAPSPPLPPLDSSTTPSPLEQQQQLLLSRPEAFLESSAYASLVRRYFDFYTDAMRFRTAIYFLHVSKAGGTSFCANSYENGCRDPNFGNGTSSTSWRWNCWSRPRDDGPKWTVLPFTEASKKQEGVPFQFAKFRKDVRNGWWAITNEKHRAPLAASCLAQEQEVLARGTTFVMNENFLPGSASGPGGFGPGVAHLCSHFLNVVLFRHPIKRALSHRTYLGILKSPLPVRDMAEYVKLTPIVSNNYYTRILGGEGVYRLPLGNVTLAHLEGALRVLQSFDVVMALESLTALGPIVVRRGLGWEKNKVLDLNKRRDYDAPLPHTQQDLRLLHALNALDLKLYAKASEMAELDFEFFRNVELAAELVAAAGTKTRKQRGDPLPKAAAAAEAAGGGGVQLDVAGGSLARAEHEWKAVPSAKDPGVSCKHTCGYTCQVSFDVGSLGI